MVVSVLRVAPRAGAWGPPGEQAPDDSNAGRYRRALEVLATLQQLLRSRAKGRG
ncbi:hypothetical protein ACWDO0_32140 [Nocardia rhamnosiphila]|uniref:hypothetical protein n=1 Tax=Nocardia rhamnosiphila TaxID=426716 RepID=UPI000A4770B9|nr:hypothetical protein [Nocardia rhamnosiphila]